MQRHTEQTILCSTKLSIVLSSWQYCNIYHRPACKPQLGFTAWLNWNIPTNAIQSSQACERQWRASTALIRNISHRIQLFRMHRMARRQWMTLAYFTQIIITGNDSIVKDALRCFLDISHCAHGISVERLFFRIRQFLIRFESSTSGIKYWGIESLTSHCWIPFPMALKHAHRIDIRACAPARPSAHKSYHPDVNNRSQVKLIRMTVKL